MICVICRNGDLEVGTSTVTLTRDSLTLVVKDVPALVCDNCGEEFIDEDVSSHLLKTAEDALKSGVQVDVRNYVAA